MIWGTNRTIVDDDSYQKEYTSKSSRRSHVRTEQNIEHTDGYWITWKMNQRRWESDFELRRKWIRSFTEKL